MMDLYRIIFIVEKWVSTDKMTCGGEIWIQNTV